jgi:hypothetical protein
MGLDVSGADRNIGRGEEIGFNFENDNIPLPLPRSEEERVNPGTSTTWSVPKSSSLTWRSPAEMLKKEKKQEKDALFTFPTFRLYSLAWNSYHTGKFLVVGLAKLAETLLTHFFLFTMMAVLYYAWNLPSRMSYWAAETETQALQAAGTLGMLFVASVYLQEKWSSARGQDTMDSQGAYRAIPENVKEVVKAGLMKIINAIKKGTSESDNEKQQSYIITVLDAYATVRNAVKDIAEGGHENDLLRLNEATQLEVIMLVATVETVCAQRSSKDRFSVTQMLAQATLSELVLHDGDLNTIMIEWSKTSHTAMLEARRNESAAIAKTIDNVSSQKLFGTLRTIVLKLANAADHSTYLAHMLFALKQKDTPTVVVLVNRFEQIQECQRSLRGEYLNKTQLRQLAASMAQVIDAMRDEQQLINEQHERGDQQNNGSNKNRNNNGKKNNQREQEQQQQQDDDQLQEEQNKLNKRNQLNKERQERMKAFGDAADVSASVRSMMKNDINMSDSAIEDAMTFAKSLNCHTCGQKGHKKMHCPLSECSKCRKQGHSHHACKQLHRE